MKDVKIKFKTMKSQYVAALSHLLLVYSCARDAVHTPYDAQWELVWSPLYSIDFPVTVLRIITNRYIPEIIESALDGIFNNVFSTYPYSSFWSFWWPIMTYGILGTLLWFYIPRLFKMLIKPLWLRVVKE